MLIRSIEMENFFRIYGKAKISFSTNENKNVIVICGENGMGKTTMLSAFYWALYGDVVLPLEAENMLNKRKQTEMSVGDTATSKVIVELLHDDNIISFSRELCFKKISDTEIISLGKPDVSVYNLTTSTKIDQDNYFENIIPSELRGFFFFDGERIDRLANIDGKKEIKKAILDLLGLTTLDNISNDLKYVKNSFNSDIKAKSFGTNTAFLSQDYEKYEKLIFEAKEIIEDQTRIKKESKKIMDECDDFLKDHNADVVNKLTEEREELTEKIKSNKENIQLNKKQISDLISDNIATYLFSSYFDDLSEFLEEKRKKKELPSDIKETFINDLIESKTCICGRELISGTSPYDTLLQLKATAGHEELDNAYVRIKAYVDSSSTKEDIENFYKEINKRRDSILEYEKETQKFTSRITQINNTLKNSDDELVSQKEILRETAFASWQSACETIAIQKDKMDGPDGYVNKQTAISKKISSAETKDKEIEMLSSCFTMSEDIFKLNEEIKASFVSMTRSDMDAKLKEVFEFLAKKKEREPQLNENFELKIVNKDSKKEQILSTGERQVTSLSFIGALVAYAKEKPTKGILSDFAGGDFPIVMDSPFGNLDANHKVNVCKGIPSLASQVVIIVSNSQWEGDVAKNVMPKVNKMYKMVDGKTDLHDAEFTLFEEVQI